MLLTFKYIVFKVSADNMFEMHETVRQTSMQMNSLSCRWQRKRKKKSQFYNYTTFICCGVIS